MIIRKYIIIMQDPTTKRKNYSSILQFDSFSVYFYLYRIRPFYDSKHTHRFKNISNYFHAFTSLKRSALWMRYFKRCKRKSGGPELINLQLSISTYQCSRKKMNIIKPISVITYQQKILLKNFFSQLCGWLTWHKRKKKCFFGS